MTKEQRFKYLKQLARSNIGEALRDYIEEKISDLKDVTQLPAEHIEVQVRANVAAIVKLREILRMLDLLKEEEKKVKKNQYK